MKITVLGKKIVAFFAIALLGFSLAGCLEESGGDVTLEKAQENVNSVLGKIFFSSDVLQNVTSNLELVKQNVNYPDVEIKWESNQEDLVKIEENSEGKLEAVVTRPELDDPRIEEGKDYVVVVLTVSASQTVGDEVASGTKEFTLRVKTVSVDKEGTILEVKQAVIDSLVERGVALNTNDSKNALFCVTYGRVLLQISKSMIISDGTQSVVVYGDYSSTCKVGDLVRVQGGVYSYFGQIEFASEVAVTKLDENDSHAGITVCGYEDATIEGYTTALTAAVDENRKVVDKEAILDFSGATYRLWAKVLKEEAAPGDKYALEDPETGTKISIYHYATDDANLAAEMDKWVGKYVYINAVTIDRYSSNDVYRVLWDGSTLVEAPAPSLDDAQKVVKAIAELESTKFALLNYNGQEFAFPTVSVADVIIDWATTPATLVQDGKLVVTEDGVAQLVATVICGDASDTVTLEINVRVNETIVTVAEAVNAAKGDIVTIQGVVEVLFGSKNNYYIADETGAILVYASCDYKLGQTVKLIGEVDVFNGTPQIKSGATVTLVEDTTWTMATPKQVTIAEVLAYTADNALYGAYLQASGVLVKSGNYYYLADATDSTKKISLYNSNVVAELAEFADTDKVVTLNFYFYGNAKSDWSGDYRVIFAGRDGEYVLPTLTDEETANKVLDNLDVPETVTDDFSLPTVDGLVWSLKEVSDVVILNGETVSVNRPAVGEADATVVFVASYTYKDVLYTKEFPVVVKALQETTGEKKVTYTFDNTTAKGTALTADTALEIFNAAYVVGDTANSLTSVTATKVYEGNGQGGAYENQSGFLKMGASKDNGELTLTFADGIKVTKVEITCHDWYTQSDTYPTNSNTVAVNDSTPVLAPYNQNGTPEVMTFTLEEATNIVKIVSAKRIFVFSITVYFE